MGDLGDVIYALCRINGFKPPLLYVYHRGDKITRLFTESYKSCVYANGTCQTPEVAVGGFMSASADIPIADLARLHGKSIN